MLKTVLIICLCLSSAVQGRSIDTSPQGDNGFTLEIKDPDGKVLHEKEMPKVPDGYKLQLLAPQLLGFTGIMPEGWYYNKSTSEDAVINFLTKENMEANNLCIVLPI